MSLSFVSVLSSSSPHLFSPIVSRLFIHRTRGPHQNRTTSDYHIDGASVLICHKLLAYVGRSAHPHRRSSLHVQHHLSGQDSVDTQLLLAGRIRVTQTHVSADDQ